MAGVSHWVFLRGLARESGHWHSFPSEFENRIPGARVTLLDLPGTGEHYQSESPSTIPEITTFAREECLLAPTNFLRQNENPRILFAISLGAMVAIEWMASFPADFDGAVLINTSLNGLNPIHRRLIPSAWMKLIKIFLTGDVEGREKKILDLTAQHIEMADEIAKRRAELFLRRPMEPNTVLRQLMAAARYHIPDTPPRVPLLLLNSLGDSLVDPRCSELLQQRWQTEMATHPTGGHDLPLVAPKWIGDEVAQWFSKHFNK